MGNIVITTETELVLHETGKLREVDVAVTIEVGLGHHGGQLRLGEILSQ